MRSTVLCLVLLSRTAFAADVTLTPPLVGGEVVTDMAVDAAGNLYMLGTFQGAEDFNGALGVEEGQAAALGEREPGARGPGGDHWQYFPLHQFRL